MYIELRVGKWELKEGKMDGGRGMWEGKRVGREAACAWALLGLFVLELELDGWSCGWDGMAWCAVGKIVWGY